MYEEYRARCQDGRFRLGDVFVWNEGDETLYTLGIRLQPADKPKIAALEQALTKMAELAHNAGEERVGLPRIGAGPGGLDWPRVKKVLSEVGEKASVTFVVFEKFIRSPGA
jgi:O-acetyl-ADP-ribose deacetylase (regulator of RNase III)